ncbi:MAG: acetyl-CoA carboxylase biotin carboxyl carrier protein [Bdellovibrionales bacterium]|nr:acetyl-CoA carboxylase biotin carboxyl carrier protein [Bdellovibrionales bacterium]
MTKGLSLDELEHLLEVLQANEVTEFELERGAERVKVKRGAPVQQVTERVIEKAAPVQHIFSGQQTTQPAVEVQAPPVAPQPAPAASAEKSEAKLSVVSGGKESGGVVEEIKSPMVGTFYRKPAPDAKTFVEVGDTVSKGTVLCIVEAMKLMNEIESEVSGRVVDICLDDAQMVEYGEVMFRIQTSG